MTIENYSAEQAANVLDDLIVLLQDGVESRASIGFLPPLSSDDARAYWQSVFDDIRCNRRILLAAWQDGMMIGSVQLELPTKPNACHRAEVQKLIVHRDARRQGWGRKLMEAIEHQARAASRMLLVLDTREADAAEQLYRRNGYLEVGRIPQYARSDNGALHPTVIFYKLLE